MAPGLEMHHPGATRTVDDGTIGGDLHRSIKSCPLPHYHCISVEQPTALKTHGYSISTGGDLRTLNCSTAPARTQLRIVRKARGLRALEPDAIVRGVANPLVSAAAFRTGAMYGVHGLLLPPTGQLPFRAPQDWIFVALALLATLQRALQASSPRFSALRGIPSARGTTRSLEAFNKVGVSEEPVIASRLFWLGFTKVCRRQRVPPTFRYDRLVRGA